MYPHPEHSQAVISTHRYVHAHARSQTHSTTASLQTIARAAVCEVAQRALLHRLQIALESPGTLFVLAPRAGVKRAPGPTGSQRARLLTAIPKKTTSFFLQPVQMRAAREPDTKIAQKREASPDTPPPKGARRNHRPRRHPFGQVENTKRKRKKKKNNKTSNHEPQQQHLDEGHARRRRR